MYKLSLHVEYKILSELLDLEDDKIYQERCDGILKLETVEFWPILSQISCIHSVKLDLYVIESNHAVGDLEQHAELPCSDTNFQINKKSNFGPRKCATS